ncbi:transketolase [Breznakia sp. PF5-3]|uniref:transketolase n=1 Tax=unclassified Breznakia TaxID=2623764 RepID=UPI0024072597|nr:MULTISPECIES: transketolase [unclassified Breznakia]MDF9824187.1 transketolase [Breznakia sp. PM6-1]MDF9834985.1 transketolase [Breznakia sp. PF5-3]
MNTQDQMIIDTLRMLSIDMVEKANSGHPGMPMGAAPIAYTLFSKNMKVSPNHPDWFNRDRFVLSAGHGSALLYSILHLYGYGLSIVDLKAFRQLHSKTPGHPEYRQTKGVDATTGPLGQGIAMAVRMALAEHHLAAKYNKEDISVIDHYTYAICGDGDLMEGVASEAASLAGHLQLGKLILLYDSNDISLDGDLAMSFSEDVKKRFDAYHWQVLHVEDGNDVDAIDEAIKAAQKETRPTLIEVKTTIGYGSPNKGGTALSHGSPLGQEEVALVREKYGWKYAPFEVPKEVKEVLLTYPRAGNQEVAQWEATLQQYKEKYPDDYKELKRVIQGVLPKDYDAFLPNYQIEDGKIATRSASGAIINALAEKVPEFFGGSADLGGSNKTFIKKEGAYRNTTPKNRNIWYGVREFGEAAMMNGISLHGGLKPFGATFFVFSDYMRAAIRLAALMQLPVIYVFTHDSIAVGEDGPTHEPIEQLASLRAMPNLNVIRPADAKECVAAWKEAMTATQPTALILSRQPLPILDVKQEVINKGVKAGAYLVRKAKKQAAAILIATGSEVALALDVQKELLDRNIDVSVVSMPSWKNFKSLNPQEQERLLPKDSIKISIEAASTLGWHEFVGDRGLVIGLDHFGASAPAKDIFEEFGFTVPKITNRIITHLRK